MQTSPVGPSSKGQVKEGDIGQSNGDLGSDDFSKGQKSWRYFTQDASHMGIKPNGRVTGMPIILPHIHFLCNACLSVASV